MGGFPSGERDVSHVGSLARPHDLLDDAAVSGRRELVY
jgi:hypothetical protein